LVLDTNVVLDWVAFGDARVRRMVEAIEGGAVRAATSGPCLAELRRALGYPQVKLNSDAQAAAIDRYETYALRFDVPEGVAAVELPRCDDPDDQKFLELAWHARAAHLVTRDKALLALARRIERLGRFSVLDPAGFDLQLGSERG
jgi:predicted nucleic acid-binding protein